MVRQTRHDRIQARKVRCPRCAAAPGAPCVGPTGAPMTSLYHTARVKLGWQEEPDAHQPVVPLTAQEKAAIRAWWSHLPEIRFRSSGVVEARKSEEGEWGLLYTRRQLEQHLEMIRRQRA